jgi:hypothetical protein
MLDVQAWVTPADNPIQPCEARFKPVRNCNFVKPMYGLWTSTWKGEPKVSGWVEWCRSESFGVGKLQTWLLTPRADARIAIVDGMDDLKALLLRYPLHLGKAEDHFLQPLDFERMAQDYDGLHLTDEGQWATRLTQPSLYGWDCESTCWFQWAFDDVEKGPPTTITERVWDWEDEE